MFDAQRAPTSAANLSSQPSIDNSPWGSDTNSTLRVKIAEEFRLAPPVQVPPALAASTASQRDFDFDYERKVMQDEASTSVDTFLKKAEQSYYSDTKAAKFLSMGFKVSTVHLAMAYRSSQGGDDNTIVDFCNNYESLLGMGFAPSLAVGALLKTKNDMNAAPELCLSLNH